MIIAWVAKILERGGDLEEAIRHSQTMAREAFVESDSLKNTIDRQFGGSGLRTNVLEPLLQKEREIDALRERVIRGGSLRTGDRGNLSSLLGRRTQEYDLLAQEIDGHLSSKGHREELDAYLDARRRQLYLGDAERVRSAIREYLAEAAIAS